MRRESLAAVLLALLAVVALGVGAATLDTAVTSGGDGFGGSAEGIGPSGSVDQDGEMTTPGEGTPRGVSLCLDFLRELPALLVLFGSFALLAGIVYRDTRSPLATVVVTLTLFLPVGGMWYILSACRPADRDSEPAEIETPTNDSPAGAGGSGGFGPGGEGSVTAPETLFLVVVVVALLASALLLFAASGDDEEDESGAEPDPSDDGPDLAALGRTAGAAADRIEAADADNEVYRAWREMTEVLDVDRPVSSTPAEFADAAIAAGVDPEPVEELTDVFERVRYGGEDPTGDREARAVEALRRIEAAHGDSAHGDSSHGESDGGGASGGDA